MAEAAGAGVGMSRAAATVKDAAEADGMEWTKLYDSPEGDKEDTLVSISSFFAGAGLVSDGASQHSCGCTWSVAGVRFCKSSSAAGGSGIGFPFEGAQFLN
jgi:hypothetical protein